MSRIRTFWNGIRSMRPMFEFRWYWWGFGLVFHFNEPSPGDAWWAMHFTEVAVVLGPLWVGVKDTN